MVTDGASDTPGQPATGQADPKTPRNVRRVL
jgi:hypothetical protein